MRGPFSAVTERASATVKLLEAYYREFGMENRAPEGSDFLEWIGLLRSCTAFEAYCKVYTADLSHDRIMEFLLLSAEFPHSVRFSVDRFYAAIEATHTDGDRQRASALRRPRSGPHKLAHCQSLRRATPTWAWATRSRA